MSAAGLRKARRMSHSEIVLLHRCPWRWHLRHVRKVERNRQGDAKPATVWGSCYHAAIAALLFSLALRQRPDLDDPTWMRTDPLEAALAELASKEIDPSDLLAHKGVQRIAGDIAEEAAEAAEQVAAWLEATGWRVAWVRLGGRGSLLPALELRVSVDLEAERVGIDGRVDAILIDPAGRVCLVDHKTVARWPERAGQVLARDEVAGVDLRDELQARMYATALRELGVRIDRAAHLMRRATIAKPPPIVYKPTDKRYGPSRAKDVETTPELYRAAVLGVDKDPDAYAEEIEHAARTRWHAWASIDLHPVALRRTLPILRDASTRAAAYALADAEDVPRHHVAGRHAGTCSRCPDRDLCVAEERASKVDAELELVGRYAPAPDRYPQETTA